MGTVRRKKALPVIGWREWVTLPDLGLHRIKAKIDTGARSSALHAVNLETYRKKGVEWVRFEVHPRQHGGPTVHAEAPIIDMRWVRNPGGRREHRPVIRTPLVLLGTVWDVDVTLTPRWGMNFRMLLGRQTVRHHFLVDPGRSFLGERDEVERRIRHEPGTKPSRGAAAKSTKRARRRDT